MQLKRRISNTTYANNAGLVKQGKNALHYLSAHPINMNRQEVLLAIENQPGLNFNTPLTYMYSRLRANRDFKQIFTTLFLTTGNVPEILTNDSITIIPDELLEHGGKIFSGPLVNTTNCIREIGGYAASTFKVEDHLKLQGLFIRAYLCTDFMERESWLNPRLVAFLVRAYNMIVMTLFRQHYSILDNLDYRKVSFIVSAFYAQQFLNEKNMGPPINTINKLNWGAKSEIDTMFGVLAENDFDFKKLYGIDELCAMLRLLGPATFKDIIPSVFSRIFSTGLQDKPFALLAAEYPPYWAFLLLHLASGGRYPIHNTILKNNRLNNELIVFAKEISAHI
jgi:hypothetical protein